MVMLRKLLIDGRNDLGNYLNTLGMHGTGVEVGTHLGEYAEKILERWSEGFLICVDPYENAPNYTEQEKFLWGETSDRRDHRQAAEQRLERFINIGRCCIEATTSEEACLQFKDGTLDFVYLDGNHREPYVSQDIRNWFLKIKPGGLLLGHDFLMAGQTTTDDWDSDIQPAILEFAFHYSSDVYMIPENDNLPWSYCLMKKE